MTKGVKKPIADYWHEHYADENCTLCGNSGIIDTRGITTATGRKVGRLNYCICPNGQVLRYNDPEGASLEKTK